MLNSDIELFLVENKPKEMEFRAPKCSKNPKKNTSFNETLKIDSLLSQFNYRLPFPVRLSK